jgi:hypothetical protein
MSSTPPKSEGVRRLSLFAGVLGGAYFLVWFVQEANTSRMEPTAWLFVAGLFAAAFLLPWALVRAIAWVARGFLGGGS